MTTTTDLRALPGIRHEEARDVAEEAYRRFVELLATLDPGDWGRPTDCTAWTVRDLAGHMLGAMRSAASLREMVRQQREVRRRLQAHGGLAVDHLTALQVELTSGLDREELVAQARRLVSLAARGRTRIPGVLRRLVSFEADAGHGPERWTLGYFNDVILTRDAWLHRIDLCRAVDRTPQLDAAHDGRIVVDVAAEWARRHGRPVELTLTGPAGGSFSAGSGGPALEIDAVECCRVLSGRAAPAHELLATLVPF